MTFHFTSDTLEEWLSPEDNTGRDQNSIGGVIEVETAAVEYMFFETFKGPAQQQQQQQQQEGSTSTGTPLASNVDDKLLKKKKRETIASSKTGITWKLAEEEQAEDDLKKEIDCAKSSASVSTMTRATHATTLPGASSSSPASYNTKKGDAAAAAKNHKMIARKRSSRLSPAGGLQKAFSKLALCGQSARQSSLDLDYLVLTLRQALTGQEAETSLRKMVKVLKGSRSSSSGEVNDDGGDNNNKACTMSTTELQEEFVAAGADHCVISTLWNFPSNLEVQYYGIIALGELVAHSHHANQKSLVLKGGIEVVLTAMKTHAIEESLQEEACRTLKNIMKYYDVAKQQVARHKGIARILQAMMMHPEYASVQRQACYALTSLSCLKSISDEVVDKQGHAVLLKTMQHHNDDPYVLAEAWRTLTNVVIHAMNTSLDEEIAAHGLDLVCQSLDKFADCTVVPIQARGLTLLSHLCYRSAANLERVTMTENLEIIHRVLRIWRYDEKVQAAGEKLVQQISLAGYHQNVAAAEAAKGEHRIRSSSRRRSSKPAVISQIQNDLGMDIILDTTLY